MEVLLTRYPPINAHPVPDKAYIDSQLEERNAAYKERNRLSLVKLWSAFTSSSHSAKVLYLEGPGFPFTKKIASSLIECHVVNWRAADLIDSVAIKTMASLRSKVASLNVYGASIGDFLSAVHLRKLCPEYSMVWLDYCGVASFDRLHEVDMLFDHGMLSTSQVVVVATTFCSKHDGVSPVAIDSTNGHDRQESLHQRAHDAAVKKGFLILDYLVAKDNGMLMMTYIVCHATIVADHLDRVRAVMADFRGVLPLVSPPSSLLFRLTKTGKVHREGVECSGVLVAEVRHGGKIPHIPVHDENGDLCKFCHKEEKGGGVKREREEEHLVPGNLYTYIEDDDALLYRKTKCIIEYIGPDEFGLDDHCLFKTLAFPDDRSISLHESRILPLRPEGDQFTRHHRPGDIVEVKIKRRTDAATEEALDGNMHETGVWVIGTCVDQTTFGYNVQIPLWSSEQPKDGYPTQIIHVPFKWVRSY